MIKMVCESHDHGTVEVTYRYDGDNKKDKALMNEIDEIIRNRQKTCFNCENCYTEPCLGGYMATACKIHGNLEAYNNPHHDTDGSKCEDYKRAEVSE